MVKLHFCLVGKSRKLKVEGCQSRTFSFLNQLQESQRMKKTYITEREGDRERERSRVSLGEREEKRVKEKERWYVCERDGKREGEREYKGMREIGCKSKKLFRKLIPT